MSRVTGRKELGNNTTAVESEPGRYPGSSGGSMWNGDGRQIGINFAGDKRGTCGWHISAPVVQQHIHRAVGAMAALKRGEQELDVATGQGEHNLTGVLRERALDNAEDASLPGWQIVSASAQMQECLDGLAVNNAP
jgi:S1-C subfamily serine protease